MTTRTRTRKPKAPPMSEAEARTFEAGERENSIAQFNHYRAARIAAGAHPADCTCEPYQDVFTARRWHAQKRRPRKGSKSFQLRTWRPIRDADELTDEERSSSKRPRLVRCKAILFCRCQTTDQPKGDPMPFTVSDEMIAQERADLAKRDQADDQPRTAPKRTPAPVSTIAETFQHIELPEALALQLVAAAEPADCTVSMKGGGEANEAHLRDLVAQYPGAQCFGPNTSPTAPDVSRWIVCATGFDTHQKAQRFAANHARIAAAFGEVLGVFLYETGRGIGEAIAEAATGEGMTCAEAEIGQVQLAAQYAPELAVMRIWKKEAQTSAA
jgi:hypothetical protein